jgi:putative phosphoribosyl transferase
MFTDRRDAGKRLAKVLAGYRDDKSAVVLALPRGGIVCAYEVARALHLPLDIVSVRKIGHPTSPEYAVCAVDEHGTRICNEDAIQDIDEKWLAEETKRQTAEAVRRVSAYRGRRPPERIAERTAILVDDGMATGLTMRAAIASVRSRGARKVVVAVPVASTDAVELISKEADEVFLLKSAIDFLGAVGTHYVEFDQVDDEKVIKLMRKSFDTTHSGATASLTRRQ